MPQFRLMPSKISNAGIGVFALCDIKKDTVLFGGIKKNEYILWKEVDQLHNNVISYIKSICLSDELGFFIDSKLSDINCSYYINHSSTPNCHHDSRNDVYYAIKDIKQDEELTCYYLPSERDWLQHL